MSIEYKKRTKESEVLGINYGTASHRLKKLLFFKMVQRLEEDICFKCNKKITDSKELSIEHKIPWLGVGAEAFWNPDNIAFSHLGCNRPRDKPTRTHCSKGHLFDEENTRRTKEGLVCRACDRQRWFSSNQRKKRLAARRHKVAKLSKEGFSTREIAKEVGVSHVSVFQDLKKKM